jgi:CubicO group peptidase (beta-lactamase class C family)
MFCAFRFENRMKFITTWSDLEIKFKGRADMTQDQNALDLKFSKLETFIFEKLSDTKLPGLSMALLRGDEILWKRGFGFRDLSYGVAVTPYTLYSIASVTKSFTCIAIMQLVEQGKLTVDDPIDAHIPYRLQPEGEPVRIWHLMSHTSGIPALAYAESVIRSVIGAGEHWLPISNTSDMLTFLDGAEDWALSKPGERWFYLNEGYVLLGAIVEECSGMPYQEYVREHILQPLGMERSFFQKEDVDNDQDAATPYIITRDGERKASVYPFGGISSDGGLISNVIDLARYISMFLGWGEYAEVRVLSRESVEAMQAARVSTPVESPFGDVGYGFGLGVVPDFFGRKLIGHSGNVGVATAYIGFVPEEDIGVALLANGEGYPMSNFGMYGLAMLMGENPEKLPFVSRERALKEIEGTYETYKSTMKAQVKKRGDFLMIEVKDKYTDATVPLIPSKLGKDLRTFYTLDNSNRLLVEFRVRKDETSMLYERYYMKKTGPLPD